MFLFKKKDPVCMIKEVKGKGVYKEGNWFCSEECLKKYKPEKKDCCH